MGRVRDTLLGIACLTGLALVTMQPALANYDARCVQQMLADAHYDIGAIDGQIGAKTRRAAEMLAKKYDQLDLPELTPDTYATWCAAAESDAFQTVLKRRAEIALVAWRELDGPASLWTAYRQVTDCDAVPRRREAKVFGRPKPFDPTRAIKPIFPPAPGAEQCQANAGGGSGRIATAKPIVDAEITGRYGGGDHDKFQMLDRVLGPAIAAYRATPSAETAAPLRTFLVNWASANALSENIWLPTSVPPPLDFGVLHLVSPMVIAYSEVGHLMTPDEAELVGRWLHRLVSEAVKSTWHHSQDNKSYMRATVALLWGILTDDQDLKDAAYAAYDEALYDMRPDGSPPMDSSRGGSGLHYANRGTMMLMSLIVAGAADGRNLMVEQRNERSFHNAARWVTVTGKFPELGTRYALSCPNSGDAATYDRDKPDTAHMMDGSFSVWASAYVMHPDADPATREAIMPWLKLKPYGVAVAHAGGSLACYAAGLFGN